MALKFNIQGYRKTQEIIFLSIAVLSLGGLIADFTTYYIQYSLTQSIITSIGILAVLLTSLAYLLRINRNIHLLFALMAYGLILSIFFTHLFGNEMFVDPEAVRTNLFLRDTLIIFCFLSISGFIGGRVHIIILGMAHGLLSLFYAFSLFDQFVLENLAVILILTFGYGAMIYFISTFIDQFINQIEQLGEVLNEQSEEMIENIEFAKRIQNSILPQNAEMSRVLGDHFTVYKPQSYVSGDFYWVKEINENVLFAVADATGSGVSGALLSVIFQNALDRSVNEFSLYKPADILNQTQRLIQESISDSKEMLKGGMDIGLCLYNVVDHTLQFSGTQISLYTVINNQLTEHFGHKEHLSDWNEDLRFKNEVIELKKGMMLYLCTDGYKKLQNTSNQEFGDSAFQKMLLDIHGLELDIQKRVAENTIETWKSDQKQKDDICFIGIKVSM